MDFNSALDIIIKDLKEAREIIDDLKNYPDVPRFQIELAKSKCKSAEEILLLLKDIESSAVNKSSKETTIVKTTAPDVEQEIPEIEISESKMAGDQTEAKKEQQIPEIKKEEVRQPEPEEKVTDVTDEVQLENRTRTDKKSSPIVADSFSKSSNIINEQLGKQKRDDDISSVVKSKPVTNLKDAIGINDKFLYIREMFEGSPTRYEEAISKLNEMHNIAEARTLIFSFVENDEENETALQLFDLVKRKLSADG